MKSPPKKEEERKVPFDKKPISRFDIFVKNLPLQIEEEHIREFFKSVGTINTVHMIRSEHAGFMGRAFLNLPDRETFVVSVRNGKKGKFFNFYIRLV